MNKREVEHRGYLEKEKFEELNKFLNKNGKFLGFKKRFSIIYSQNKENESNKLCHSPIDLKLRITNKKAELVLKYGKWSGNDARKEFLFPIELKKFEEMIEFLQILGHYHGVLQATNTFLYKYNGIDFSLVEVPGWGYYFEGEIITYQNKIKKANEKIKKECQKLDIDILNHKNFCELLSSLNKRPGFRFNFKKEKFSKIKESFIAYF
jgi:adenylate cyclase class IV